MVQKFSAIESFRVRKFSDLESFTALKMHLRKEANIPDDTETEVNAKKQIIDASVEQKTIYEEDDCLHCGLCSFSSKSKKNILRHSNLVHGVVINDKVRT